MHNEGEHIKRNLGVGLTAIIIVDHGSRRSEANEMLHEFVQLFSAHSSYQIVEPAHMELAEPSIAMAFGRCVKQGAKHIVVTPYFLSPGRHWGEDIPCLASEAAERHVDVSFQVTHPIGLHPLMVEIVASRIDECLSASRIT